MEFDTAPWPARLPLALVAISARFHAWYEIDWEALPMDTSELGWTAEIWNDLSDHVLKEVGKVRVAQKVFSTLAFTNDPTHIPAQVIGSSNLTVGEGSTKPLVELSREFSLTGTQVHQEAEQKVARALARMASKGIALAEDANFFQLSYRHPARRGPSKDVPEMFNPSIDALHHRKDVDFGLLGTANDPEADDRALAKPCEPINVDKLAAAAQIIAEAVAVGVDYRIPSREYGENMFKAVTAGITRLVSKVQAPPFALFLPTAVYADTYVPPSSPSLVATADIGAIIDGTAQPPAPVGLKVLPRHALEATQEVKSLGTLILAALEKKDTEPLIVRRAKHAVSMLGRAESVKYGEWQEAIKNREEIVVNMQKVLQRFGHYDKLLGTEDAQIKLPGYPLIDGSVITEQTEVPAEPIVDAGDLEVTLGESYRSRAHKIFPEEAHEFNLLEASGRVRCDMRIRVALRFRHVRRSVARRGLVGERCQTRVPSVHPGLRPLGMRRTHGGSSHDRN